MEQILLDANAQIPVRDCLVTTKQIASYIGVTTSTIRNYRLRREMPNFRLPGGDLRFRPSDVDRWLAGFQKSHKGNPSWTRDARAIKAKRSAAAKKGAQTRTNNRKAN